MNIEPILSLTDNYIWLLTEENNAAVIDPSEDAPVNKILEQRGLTLTDIFVTHHHGDHIGGVEALKEKHHCSVYMSDISDDFRTGYIAITDKSIISFAGNNIKVIAAKGHTKDHVLFYLEQQGCLFVGDTLFSLGCGKIFEGTPEELFTSLQIIKGLPDDTQIYSGHEYTIRSAESCLQIDPENKDLLKRVVEVTDLRKEGKPTYPVSLAKEKQTNPFLRAKTLEDFTKIL